MNREELRKLVDLGIKDALISKIKQDRQESSLKSSQDYLNSNEITDEDFDSVLFFGGEKQKEDSEKKVFTIKEAKENSLQITTSEIKNFEQSFKEVLSAIPGSTVVFNKQKNGYSLLALKKPNGIEAIASGVINLGDNGKIIWMYSIMNGLIINAQNLKINNDNKIISEIIFNHFNTWQTKWREKLNFPELDN